MFTSLTSTAATTPLGEFKQPTIDIQYIEVIRIQPLLIPIKTPLLKTTNQLLALLPPRLPKCIFQILLPPNPTRILRRPMPLPTQTQNLRILRRAKLCIGPWCRPPKQRKLMMPAITMIILARYLRSVFPLRLLIYIR